MPFVNINLFLIQPNIAFSFIYILVSIAQLFSRPTTNLLFYFCTCTFFFIKCLIVYVVLSARCTTVHSQFRIFERTFFYSGADLNKWEKYSVILDLELANSTVDSFHIDDCNSLIFLSVDIQKYITTFT